MTRVLIVDDSATMRKLIRKTLEQHPQISVVGEAAHAHEAKSLLKTTNPDVLTLDIEMPHMSGLEFLEKLMRLRPMPVVMLSSLTGRATAETIKALELGAVDCVCKPNATDPSSLADLPNTVRAAARAKVIGRPETAPVATPSVERKLGPEPGRSIIMIGSSTGGVEALSQVLRHFPENCPPTFITQHIPAHFSASFAKRLNSNCAPNVMEASDGLVVKKGMVVIAPGSAAHLEMVMTPYPTCRLRQADKVSGHRPSVDVLFNSGTAAAKRISAAILTGMGQDGAEGMLALRNAGAKTYAQDKASCVVYGMPRAAMEIGAASEALPLRRIAQALLPSP